jgi:hypothetical protein
MLLVLLLLLKLWFHMLVWFVMARFEGFSYISRPQLHSQQHGGTGSGKGGTAAVNYWQQKLLPLPLLLLNHLASWRAPQRRLRQQRQHNSISELLHPQIVGGVSTSSLVVAWMPLRVDSHLLLVWR